MSEDASLLEELRARYTSRLSPETVAVELADATTLYGGGVTSPLVVAAVRKRLDLLLVTTGLDGVARPHVLFVCVHNAGRSQLAAALLVARGGDRVTVSCAGSDPRPCVHAVVSEVLAESGLEPYAEPRRLDLAMVRAADLVVTMGCGDACPVLPGTVYLDWAVDDPADQALHVVRRIRDDIADRVDALLAALPSASAS